ncbi:MAG: acyl-CoA dehydrogenase [Chloroflexota bacterium]|jgi:alkylation response protein AidB-like acyl-CoA dehydrogenase|nr:acyl-CoA dehydrogenase [Chloroflexota bacterium]
MTATAPREPALTTGSHHIPEVQSSDWYSADEHLQWLVRRDVGEAAWPVADAALRDAGTIAPTRIDPLMPVLEANPPVLRQYDHRGQRVDEVDYHPYFKQLEGEVHRFGLVRMGYIPGWRGLEGTAPASLHSGCEYFFLQADQTFTGCSIAMVSAMARALARNDKELAAKWIPRLASDVDGEWMRAAMFLTEKAGGSDVGANECRAVRDEDGNWRLYGEKWFATNPTFDLALVLARPEGAGTGTSGLGLFLMPRVLPEGVADNSLNADPRRNAYIFHRLKPKFGNKALASSEMGLRGAFAWPVGDIDRGMKQMLDMVNYTRVGIVMASAASMRRAVFESIEHASRRVTFGQVLDHHPLMRDTLVDLVVDATATLSAGIAVGADMEAADRRGDAERERVLRMLTPMLKGYAAERARIVATEAMEVRGGNGYIEDWPNGRILRDVYVHAIWEGSGNIMALDVLRAISKGAAPAYFDEVERLCESALGRGPASELSGALLGGLASTREAVAQLGTLELDAAQLRMRRLERRMAMTYMAALLASQAQDHFADTGSGRLAYIAARFAARLAGPDAEAAVGDDAAWLPDFDAIVRGGHVAPETGARASAAVAAHLAAAVPA